MTSSAIISTLTSNDPSSLKALRACYSMLGESGCFAFFRAVDDKCLYGQRIGELFQLCGNDPRRFMYHVTCELPNQKTGVWQLMPGPHYLVCNNGPFKSARMSRVKPNSFWALQKPPINPDYDYPIF